MKIQAFLLRTSLSFLLAFFTFSSARLTAQTQPSSASATQAAPAVPARITQAIDDTQLVTLKGNVQLQARPEFDKGPVSPAQPMKRMMLLLQRSPEQQAALQQLMAEQLSKDSPNFHKWLTPVQFGQQFGPGDADIQTVTDWLTRQGFNGIKVANGRTVIEFSGNAGQVRNTFHTEIHNFVVDGKNYSANVSDPQIPAALTPVVKGIVSLHNFPRQSFRKDAGIHTILRDSHGTPQFTTPTGCGPSQAQPCYFVGPADFAKIYNIPSNLDGTGVTIGIVGDSNIDPNDIIGFRTVFGLLPATGPTITVDGPDPGISGPQGDEGEGDLDVETAGGVAPKATINFVVAESTLTALGADIATLRLVDDNIADVITESFGQCELAISNSQGSLGFYQATWEQAAAQGTSVMVSAGDNGSAGCDNFNTEAVATNGLAVNGVASTPNNVAVGGTDFDDFTTQTNFWNTTNAAGTLESAKGYINETTWNDSCAATATAGTLNTVCANATLIVGGSGGPSGGPNKNVLGNAKPAYQNGLTPADMARDLPDVSLFASNGPQSHSFYPVCEADAAGGQPSCTGNQFVIGAAGGTSASSPAFAGIMALIDQQQKGRQGNPNLVLYQIAATAPNGTSVCNSSTIPLTGSTTCAFYDITKGNNSVPCAGGSTNCSSPTAGTNGVLVDPANLTTPAWTTKAGYDLATGLGSVNVANLATAWATAVGAFKGTTTGLTLNGGTTTVTITHGATVTGVATVAVVSPATGTPTGDVALLANDTSKINSGNNFGILGFGGAAPGTADLSTTFLPGGSYNVTAHYAGDGTFGPSDSNPVPVVVNKENSRLQYEVVLISPTTGQITTLGPTTYVYGSQFSFLRMDILNSSTGLCQIFTNGGDVSGCAIDSTGKVMVTDNGSPLDGGTFNVNAAGHVEDQNLQLTAGAHTLSGTYSGDISYNPTAAPVVVTTTVTQAPTTASVTPNPATVAVTLPVVLTATVATSSVSTVGPTGTVTFFNGGTAIGSPVNVTMFGATSSTFAGATATLSTSFTSSGTKMITAMYNGDTNYAASAVSAVATVTVTAQTGSFTVAGSATPVTAGGMGSSTITVTPAGGFTGMVAITCPTLPPGVTCSTLNINVTTAAAVTGTLTVNTTANSSSLMASVVPTNHVLSASNAAPAAGGKGWWTLSGGTGVAALVLLFLPGRKRYRAALGLGLVCILGFTLGCGSGTHAPVATMTQLTVNSTKVAQNGNITVSATITPNTATGSVQFLLDGTAVGQSAPLTNGTTGQITTNTGTAVVGTHTLSAQYMPGTGFTASKSGTLNIAVTGTTQLAITGTSGSTTANGNLSLTIN